MPRHASYSRVLDLLKKLFDRPSLQSLHTLPTDLEARMKTLLTALIAQAHLTTFQWKVLTLRYGLSGGRPLQLPALARRLRITLGPISDAETRAIERLRAWKLRKLRDALWRELATEQA